MQPPQGRIGRSRINSIQQMNGLENAVVVNASFRRAKVLMNVIEIEARSNRALSQTLRNQLTGKQLACDIVGDLKQTYLVFQGRPT